MLLANDVNRQHGPVPTRESLGWPPGAGRSRRGSGSWTPTSLPHGRTRCRQPWPSRGPAQRPWSVSRAGTRGTRSRAWAVLAAHGTRPLLANRRIELRTPDELRSFLRELQPGRLVLVDPSRVIPDHSRPGQAVSCGSRGPRACSCTLALCILDGRPRVGVALPLGALEPSCCPHFLLSHLALPLGCLTRPAPTGLVADQGRLRDLSAVPRGELQRLGREAAGILREGEAGPSPGWWSTRAGWSY